MAEFEPSPPDCGIAAPATQADEFEAVRAVFGSDFADLASLFQRDAWRRIGALRKAHTEGDHALLASTAHTFCGSSAAIGATGLARLCGELERRAKSAAPDDFGLRIAGIEDEYRRVGARLLCFPNESTARR